MPDQSANLSFFLGKMEGLRYPVVVVNYDGNRCLAYSEAYIKELLAGRQVLLTPHDGLPKEITK